MLNDKGMRKKDWLIFYEAAKRFRVWILVRWTNPESFQYIGKDTFHYQYRPKPLDLQTENSGPQSYGQRTCRISGRPGYRG